VTLSVPEAAASEAALPIRLRWINEASDGPMYPIAASFCESSPVRREEHMDLIIPASLRMEHEELHRELASATKKPGPLGEAARAVARVLHPHFVDEERFALPPLGLLAPLARGERISDAAAAIAMAARLRTELPRMLAEHQAIAAALERLAEAARAAGDGEVLRLAEKIASHAKTEEEVMYPAAILVGEHLKRPA
jgi:hemerythrin HHE cation binding domain-containing protein